MRLLLCLSLAMLMLGCGGARETVQEHRIQKRHHSRGWHVDLRPGRSARAAHGRASAPALPDEPVTDAGYAPVQAPEPLASAGPVMPTQEQATAPWPVPRDEPAVAPPVITADAPRPPAPSQEEDENIMPRKRWNGLAIPAFIAGLATIALGFSTNLAALAAAVVLTLVLAGWSLARIRRREQAGKGFAMAALLIGVFAALLTAIAIARYGMEL